MPVLRAPGAAPSAPTDAPDQDALVTRATEYVLPSGRRIWWLAPDEMEMLAFTGDLPDPITGAVYLMLRDEGALKEVDDAASYQRDRNFLKAQYTICKHGFVKPRFDPDLAIGDEGTWGRRDLPRGDRLYVYNWLFLEGTSHEAWQAARADESRRAAQPASDRGALPPDASTTAGDSRSGAGVLPEPGGAAGRGESSTEA